MGQHAEYDSGVKDFVEAEFLGPRVRTLSSKDRSATEIRRATSSERSKSRLASDSNNRRSECYA
jgi:hypothetical protein